MGEDGALAGGERSQAREKWRKKRAGRASALMAKETERWLDAVAKAVREGFDGFQIQQVVAEVVAEDPVGTARFMENTHRPTQAMAVVSMDEEAEEWEHSARTSAWGFFHSKLRPKAASGAHVRHICIES
ncbi:unnamed protein product [Effrenium voratum]|nr:unnamed protein product [Effrenium voratum]